MEKKFWDYGPLHVSENHRYLQTGDRPFFWLGDTAWLIFQKCELEEAKMYLADRKSRGFNVIQATLFHTYIKYGPTYIDPTTPAYWDRCERIVEMAEDLGLYMALLPIWGSFVSDGSLNLDNAQKYADFLKERFGRFPNIIWMMGGDVRGSDAPEVFHTFGCLIRERFPDALMGYHPFGRTSSSMWFHNEPWLDFNMFQSGHRRYDQRKLSAWDDQISNEEYFGEDNWRYVRRDLALTPPKPVVDGEPSYERILQGLHDPTQPYWQASDVRRYAWWSVLEGAMGHTYGHSAIIQFHRPGDPPSYGVLDTWQEALTHPGASQMHHLKDLMESVDYPSGKANDSRLSWGQKEKYDRVCVFEGPGYIITYNYTGKPFALDLSDLTGKNITARPHAPASGKYSEEFSVTPSKETVFEPDQSASPDWAMLIKF